MLSPSRNKYQYSQDRKECELWNYSVCGGAEKNPNGYNGNQIPANKTIAIHIND
jgi:hypothetical protein